MGGPRVVRGLHTSHRARSQRCSTRQRAAQSLFSQKLCCILCAAFEGEARLRQHCTIKARLIPLRDTRQPIEGVRVTRCLVRRVKGSPPTRVGVSIRVPPFPRFSSQKVAVMCDSTAQCDRLLSMTRVQARRARFHAPLCALRTLCLITRF